MDSDLDSDQIKGRKNCFFFFFLSKRRVLNQWGGGGGVRDAGFPFVCPGGLVGSESDPEGLESLRGAGSDVRSP